MYKKEKSPKSNPQYWKRILLMFTAVIVMAVVVVIASDVAAPHEANIAGSISDEYAPYADYVLTGPEDSNSYTESEQPTSYTGGVLHSQFTRCE